MANVEKRKQGERERQTEIKGRSRPLKERSALELAAIDCVPEVM